jgi:hypothetical protein
MIDRIAHVIARSGGQPPHPRDIWKKKKGIGSPEMEAA